MDRPFDAAAIQRAADPPDGLTIVDDNLVEHAFAGRLSCFDGHVSQLTVTVEKVPKIRDVGAGHRCLLRHGSGCRKVCMERRHQDRNPELFNIIFYSIHQ